MNLPLAPIAGAVLGVAAAAGVAAMPSIMLEGLVMDSGLPAVFAAAEPPLGMTARIALALATGSFVAVFGWFACFIAIGTRGLSVQKPATGRAIEDLPAPTIRRADAHPDAPPRPPLLATRDLGTPFLDVRAEEKPVPAPVPAPPPVAIEQPLPQDLDQPLAAFDPGALLEEPLPAPSPLPPLRRPVRPPVFEEHERFDVFELKPPLRPQPMPRPVPCAAAPRPQTEATVHALLERLERGVVQRGIATASHAAPSPREAERGLEEALVTLRNLARRA